MPDGSQIIVDASALLAVLMGEPERESILRRTSEATLIAPASLPWEVGNALSAMMRRSRIDGVQAGALATNFARVPIRLVEVDLVTALEVAERHRLYAYDAYFLVCAAVHRAPLLTLDVTLARATRDAGLRVLEVE